MRTIIALLLGWTSAAIVGFVFNQNMFTTSLTGFTVTFVAMRVLER